MEITDLTKLGTQYNIIDKNGDRVKTVRVLYNYDILSSALGEFSEVAYLDFEDYLKQSHTRLSGFIEDPHSVLWHTCTEHEYDIAEIVNLCMDGKYETVIVEILVDDMLDFLD